MAIFALPAGIIGTGLALKIEEEERNQIRNRKKVAAAILIQRAYRCWKANINHEMVARFFREKPMAIYKQHDYRKMAEKFIALAQFTIAKNKFRELMRPIDMKTVIQSYRDGQTEVLLRSKLLHQSVDELSRRVELGENRVASLSMRLESRQATFETRMEGIRSLLETCHRQLLASQALIELSHPHFPIPPTPSDQTSTGQSPVQTGTVAGRRAELQHQGPVTGKQGHHQRRLSI